jgi:hypothetical protein
MSFNKLYGTHLGSMCINFYSQNCSRPDFNPDTLTFDRNVRTRFFLKCRLLVWLSRWLCFGVGKLKLSCWGCQEGVCGGTSLDFPMRNNETYQFFSIFSSTNFDENIIFVLSKGQTFRIRSTFGNPAQFLILVTYLILD